MNEALIEKLKHVPAKPGAYMMKDEHEEVIYVGKAASLRSRVRSYFQKGQSHPPKVSIMLTKVADVDWLVTGSEVEALMLECNLIKQYRPHYNVRLRDDKHYPFLCVTTSEPFPRVIVVRRARQDGNRYFGPFADSTAMRESKRIITRVFRVRACGKKLTGTENDRPCLNLHLGLCDSPCSNGISSDRYQEMVRDVCLFLEGKLDDIVDRLERDMYVASDELEFEKAARIRDQIESLNKVVERQKAISTEFKEQDVVAISGDSDSLCVQLLFIRAGRIIGQEHFFMVGVSDEPIEVGLEEFVKQYYRDAAYVPREIIVSHELPELPVLEELLLLKRGEKVKIVHPKRGEKRRLVEMASENAQLTMKRERTLTDIADSDADRDLKELRETLGMEAVPARIEAYDISNVQGKDAVGSMVVFEQGVPAKSQYRRFRIRGGDKPDDYGMMCEVLLRRFARIDDPKFRRPDLMVIDGGRGQLNVALDAQGVSGYSMPIISLAKRLEEVYTSDRSEPILLPRDSYALKLLQRIRDEAHRYALSYHHNLHEKSVRKSILDSIPGIGDQRRKALVRKFGSVVGVSKASVEELVSVPGITRPVAQAVYDFLHNG